MAIQFSISPITAPAHCVIFTTAWGYAGLVCHGETVAALQFGYPNEKLLRAVFTAEFGPLKNNHHLLPPLQQALHCYFDGQPDVEFSCRVDINWATPFGRKVLRQCSSINPGQTTTYQQLAARAGSPAAARAAGSIMASNRCPILIPCHRVIRADGSPGGYSAPGGCHMKQKLLEYEKRLKE